MRTSSKKIISYFFTLFLLFTYSGYSQFGTPVRAENGMVVSISELATQVGVEILKQGGNSIDAAVATGFALAVTYPAAGNLGGGGFMVIHLSDGTNTTIDFREKAPISSFRNMYLNDYGEFVDTLSVAGITSSGVPGSVAGLIYALDNYGTMPLEKVIEPAIELAENGFILDYKTANDLEYNLERFENYESSLKVFSKNGEPYKEGELFKQPYLARTLKQVKEKGRDGFYTGEVAGLIVDQFEKMNGYLTLEDLQTYEPVERKPVTGTFNGYEIISMPPPSSGGVAIIEMLNILNNFEFDYEEWGSSKYIHYLSEVMKFAYSDRAEYLGDADFFPVPVEKLISREYANTLSEKISEIAIPSEEISTSVPVEFEESTETTHFSVYDKYGNAVSVTTTLNSWFGNKIIVDGAGFLLNNEMDDFSSKPGEPNQFGLVGSEANAIEPGKRMLSSMTPTIVLKDDKPFIILGAPGGSTIITSVLQVLLNIIEFNMDYETAVDLPRIHHQWFPDKIDYEKFGMTLDVKENLIKRGHNIGKERTIGRVMGILIDNENNVILSYPDPRADGYAAGY